MEVTGEIKFSLVSHTETELVAEMPIKKGILNPFGVVNAGAILWFADVTASALILEGRTPEEGMAGFPLAINLNANLLGNNTKGKFIARATYVKKGGTVIVVRTIVVDQNNKQIADVTTTHVLTK